jgi:ribonuclease HI
VKRAEEYLSTIRKTPKLKKKFKKFIEALIDGQTATSAGKNASLKSVEVAMALDAMKALLSEEPVKKVKEKERKIAKLGLTVFSDGGSRGNPGKSACAAIIYDAEGDELLRRSRKLGVTTNNVAEYEGVILGMQLALDLGATELHLKLDSELVVRQLNEEYKVKSSALKPLYLQAVRLLRSFPKATVSYVPRQENKEADKLVNKTLDGKK